MDFGWSAAESELHERAFAFARDQLNDRLDERLRARALDPEAWRRLAEFGLLGASVPEALGGLGLNSLATAHLVEALGRGCFDMGLVFSAMAHLFACTMPILEHANEDLKAELVPRLVDGTRIGANAITEAEAGSDAFALQTRAVKEGDSYVLTGTKSYVTNGPLADVFVVYASTDRSRGHFGVTAFVVERETAGLVRGERFAVSGLATSSIGSLYLEGCRVPAKNRLGGEGEGAEIFKRSMAWERTCLFAAYVGVMDRQLATCVRFAGERRQFQRPIGRNQAVSHRIADMALRLESARLLLYRACWLRDRGEEAGLAVALAKLAVSEAALASGIDAIRIHGGLGVMSESGIERDLHDAIPSTIFSGTSDMQRTLIAAALGL